MLFVLNFPRVGVWVRILRMPQRYLQVSILLFCIIGAYALRQSSFDVLVMIVFGVFGYVLGKLDWPAVPLVIALILGPMMERALRAGLELSDGDATVFLTTPISAALIAVTAVVLIWALTSAFRGRKPGIPGNAGEADSPTANATK